MLAAESESGMSERERGREAERERGREAERQRARARARAREREEREAHGTILHLLGLLIHLIHLRVEALAHRPRVVTQNRHLPCSRGVAVSGERGGVGG